MWMWLIIKKVKMKIISRFSGVKCFLQDKKRSRFGRRIIEFSLDLLNFEINPNTECRRKRGFLEEKICCFCCQICCMPGGIDLNRWEWGHGFHFRG